MTAAARAHLTALVAAFILLKAVAYFLDQRGLVLSHNAGTGLWGAGYTDVQALLPAKEILSYISIVVAVAILVFSNAFIRNLVWPGIAIGMLALSAVAIGGIYPAAVQTFTVKPNIRDKEATYIKRSIDATRAAFGLSEETLDYQARAQAPSNNMTSDMDTVANIRLLDPSVVSATYTQLQQVRGFYDFTQKLDIDRYTINGKLQDYVVGVRELDYKNLAGQQTNWQNQHTIYTHGYGFTAAPANQTVCSGQPFFVSGFLDKQSEQTACQSDTDQIPVKYPRIYYGENMTEYALVGKPTGGRDVEYDRPTGSADQYVTYDGSGGIPIGSYWRRMLYAYEYRETNFLISSVFNDNTQWGVSVTNGVVANNSFNRNGTGVSAGQYGWYPGSGATITNGGTNSVAVRDATLTTMSSATDGAWGRERSSEAATIIGVDTANMRGVRSVGRA